MPYSCSLVSLVGPRDLISGVWGIVLASVFFVLSFLRSSYHFIRPIRPEDQLTGPVDVESDMGSCPSAPKCELCHKKCECVYEVPALKGKIRRLNELNSSLQNKLFQQEQRFDELTKQMAQRMDEGTRGKLENTNDTHTPVKIAGKFKVIRETKWLEVVDCLRLHELSAIDLLIRLLQACYKFCHEEVRRREDAALLIHDTDDKQLKQEQVDTDRQEVHAVLYKRGRSDRAMSFIKKEWHSFSQKMNERKVIEEKLEEDGKDVLVSYLDDCVECCWLMVLSQPQILLKFPDEGYPLDSTTKHWFDIYTTQDPVVQEKYSKGAVLYVVWPAVLNEQQDGIYQKGEVVTVDQTETTF